MSALGPTCAGTRFSGAGMASAKTTLIQRLADTPARRETNVPLQSASARRADPLLISEASEYVRAAPRDDQPVIAGAPGNYYRETGEGNRLAFGLTGIRTLNHSGQPSRTSPLGQQEGAGQ